MSNHITINGRTFASVEEMPPEIRREYESAMQMLARNTGVSVNTADSDVSVSMRAGGPGHLISRVAVQRFVVNGKECHDWKDIPAEARAAFQDAALGDRAPDLIAPGSQSMNISRAPTSGTLQGPMFYRSSTITMSLATLIVLLLLALLAGVFIGWKLLH